MPTRRLSQLVLVIGILIARTAIAAASVAAPTQLTASAFSSSLITLSWSYPNVPVDSFLIERSMRPTRDFVAVGTTVANVRNFQNGALTPATTYYYRIRAVLGGSKSPRSAIVSATTAPQAATTVTPVRTSTPVRTATPLPTATATVVATQTQIATQTPLPTQTPVRTQTPVPTQTALPTTTRTATPLPTATVTVTSTRTPLPTSTPIPTTTATITALPTTTATVTALPTRTATTTPLPTATPDGAPPSIPTGLGVSAMNCTRLDLAWAAAADSGGSGLKGYNVYRNGAFLRQVLAPLVTTSDTGLAGGAVYGYALQAVDNAGNTSGMSSTANANTPPCNQPPVASAGADQSVTLGAPAGLDGSASHDADGTIASFQWSFGDGATATGAIVNHTYATAGTYTATLTVTDDDGAQANDSAVITVNGGTGGTVRWQRRSGGTGYDAGQAIVAAPNGDTIVTGYFNGSVDFGTGALTSAGASDAFLARYSATGTPLWTRRIGGALADAGTGVALAADGTIVVTGTFSGTIDLGAGALTSVGGSDVFLAKYSAAGALVWAQRFGGSNGDISSAVAIESATGMIVLTGAFVGTADFGTGALTSSFGSPDIFLATYNESGAVVWSKRFGGASNDFVNGLAVDRDGNIVLVGSYMGAADFGGGPLPRTTVGSDDIFVAKLSPTGAHLWSKRFGDSQSDHGQGVAIDGDGNVIVTGYIYGPVDFGGGALHNTFGEYDGDVFVAKFSPAGTHVWSMRFGGSYYDYGQAIAADAAGNVFVTGFFQYTATVGSQTLTSAGAFDMFVTKLAANGVPIWAKRFGGTADDTGRAIAVDGSGSPVVTGEFWGTSTFGSTPLTSAGMNDGVTLALNP